jgi:predicted nucleic acid-binding protein
MTDRPFVDTNVLVYAYDEADQTKQDQALRFLASVQPSALVISAQVLSEFYVVVSRRLAVPLPEPEAADVVRSLRKLTTVPLTADLVISALEVRAHWQTSYWDALIVAAAEAAGCTRIVSEDLPTGTSIAGMTIENPFA